MSDIVLAAINAKWIHPSLALRLLKANLGEYESRCEIVEFAPRQSLEEKLGILAGFRPKILGLSVSIWNHKASLELLGALREPGKNNPGRGLPTEEPGGPGPPVVVLGGPEVSCLPEESEIIRYADFVIRGEGEEAFAELCGRLLNGEKPRSRFIDGRAADLAVLNPAYRLYSDEDLRRKLVYVEASRDCPFACAFCQSAIKTARAEDSPCAEASRRKSVREFPLDGFLSGMEDLLERLFSVRRVSEKSVPPSALKRPTIKFLDRSFNADIPRALSIMEFFLEKMSRVSAGFQLHFEMVPSLFSPDLIKMISRFPPETLRLELGVQSLNPEVCAAIGRPSFPEKELETLALLRARTNAIIHADLIAGLPGEDCASFGDGFDRLWQALTVSSVSGGMSASGGASMSGAGPGTADTIAPPRLPSAAPPFEIQLGILKGLPGTPLGKLDKKFGMRYSPEPPYEVIETAALGKADLDRLRNFARFWELIVNRPWKAGGNPAAALLVPGKPVFRPFMDLAEKLFRFFGRNWGIDRKALGGAVLDFSGRDAITGA